MIIKLLFTLACLLTPVLIFLFGMFTVWLYNLIVCKDMLSFRNTLSFNDVIVGLDEYFQCILLHLLIGLISILCLSLLGVGLLTWLQWLVA